MGSYFNRGGSEATESAASVSMDEDEHEGRGETSSHNSGSARLYSERDTTDHETLAKASLKTMLLPLPVRMLIQVTAKLGT